LFLLGPNILLSTLFSKTLSLHFSLNVSDQVLHPHQLPGKITVLCILTQCGPVTQICLLTRAWFLRT
jgi:hypothetical protein